MAEHKGYDRLVNFTDAVVAIAATLLILPVVEAASNVNDGSVDTFMVSVVPQLLMFLLSFVVIGNFWLEHHRLFRRIDKFDTPTILMNFLWLIGVVVMPVPTALVVRGNSHDAVSVSFYIGTMLWISLVQYLMAEWVHQHPELEHGSAPLPIRVLGPRVAVFYMALAWVIGVSFPGIGLWALMVMFFVPVTVRIVKRAKS